MTTFLIGYLLIGIQLALLANVWLEDGYSLSFSLFVVAMWPAILIFCIIASFISVIYVHEDQEG